MQNNLLLSCRFSWSFMRSWSRILGLGCMSRFAPGLCPECHGGCYSSLKALIACIKFQETACRAQRGLLALLLTPEYRLQGGLCAVGCERTIEQSLVLSVCLEMPWVDQEMRQKIARLTFQICTVALLSLAASTNPFANTF